MKKPASNMAFKCPYNEFSCDFVNTPGGDMTCRTCVHYHNGVKATGAMPIFNFLGAAFKFIYSKLIR